MLGLKLGLLSNYHGFQSWRACGAFHYDMDFNFICLKGIEVPIGTNGVLVVAFLKEVDRSITDSMLLKNEILVWWLGAIVVVVHSNISGSGYVITSWRSLGESCCLDALVLIVVG